MTKPMLHPFVELDEADRTHWLAMLFDAPGTPPPFGIRYPVLRAGESPYTWLCDQFQKAQDVAGKRDRIRRSVAQLLITEAFEEPVRDRPQVLGQLLEVAGSCGFTGISEKLRGWVKEDSYADATYRLGQQAIPLRRTLWSILIAWRKTPGLRGPLCRDLERPGLGSQQLCFVELGRLAPREAIRRIPEILDWEEHLWREAMADFLSSLGAREALARRNWSAWKDCLRDIFFFRYREELLTGALAPLRNVLLEAGILYDELRGELRALSAAPLADFVKVDSRRMDHDWDSMIADFANQSLRAAPAGAGI